MRNKPFIGTLEKFFTTFDVPHKLIRYWDKECLKDIPDTECEYGYITQIIKVSETKTIVGIQSFDERYPENKYPSVNYYDLSNLEIKYVEKDAEDES